jgi:thermostable 8-oxoguanine DNA glycosylase
MRLTNSIIISLCLCIASCADTGEEDRLLNQEVIEEGVRIRVEEFRSREWSKCLEEAQRLAIIRADSIIRARAKTEAIEAIIKPPRPDKPVKPQLRTLPDSLRRQPGRDSI